MIQLNTNILSWKLRVQITKKRGDSNASPLFPSLEELAGFRSGNKISRFFRHFLEKQNIRKFLGGNLALFVMVSGLATPGAGALVAGESEVNTLEVGMQPVSTEVVLQYPVETVIVNQPYRRFHPGVDFEGVTGDPIRAVMKGTVTTVEKSRFGYGNSIIITHEKGYASRYAHLSRIDVKQGDEVDTRTVIGALGATGRATGDHLHLEIYQEGKTINPQALLPR